MSTSKNTHLIMLAQSLEQPRIVKRIIEQSSEYRQVDVIGFRRQIHTVKNYDVLKNYKNITLKTIGSIPDGKYLRRIFAYLKLVFFLYGKYGIKPKKFYVFGMDLRIISALTLNKKIDYEISDILWLYKKPPLRNILMIIDRNLAQTSNTIVFTSKGFYLKYYNKYVSKEKTVIKENRFKTYGKVKPIPRVKNDRIRIAYIGAFRYGDIINSLLITVSKRDDIDLNFYGDGNGAVVVKMKKYADEYSNITYNGPFKNPDDLEEIYAENNLNFVVYNNTLDNERVAMPNKYYESGYFNVPIVCASGTYVGERVLRNGMGWVSDIGTNDISDFLNSITVEDLTIYHESIKKLDKAEFSC